MNLPLFINNSLMTEAYPTHLAAPACTLPNPHKTKLFLWQQVNNLSQAPEMCKTSDSWIRDTRKKKNQTDFCHEFTHLKRWLWMTSDTYKDNRILLLLGVLNPTGNSESYLVLMNSSDHFISTAVQLQGIQIKSTYALLFHYRARRWTSVGYKLKMVVFLYS